MPLPAGSVDGTLGTGHGGTGTASAFADGSVIIAGPAGVYTSDAALFFDRTNKRLGIGTNAPTVRLDTILDAGGTAFAIGSRLANTTPATSGATRQYSPAYVFSGTGWDTDGAGASKTVRAALQMRSISGTSVMSQLVLAMDEDGAGTFTDRYIWGPLASGQTQDFRIGNGNLVFSKSGRGIQFLTNPLTDAPSADCSFFAGTDNKITFNTFASFVYIEGNTSAFGPGTVPMFEIRGFDQSVSSPVVNIRHRSVPFGTAAAGFGVRQLYQASSTTTGNQDVGAMDFVWSDPTHASRSGDAVINLVDAAAALAEKFRVKSTGVVQAIAAGIYAFNGRARISSPADSQLLVTDAAGTAFARLMFGGTSNAFPAVKRNAAVLEVKLADDSDYAELKAKVLRISDGAFLLRSAAAFTDGAGALAGTLTNAPAVGDPTKWIPIDDNGTTRYIPAW